MLVIHQYIIRKHTQLEPAAIISNMTGSSAFTAIGHIFLCYILFSSFHANKPFVHGAGVVGAKPSTVSSYTCSSSGHGKGLKIVHRYGPCSPNSRGKLSVTSSQVLLRDEIRVKAVNYGVYRNKHCLPVGAGDYLVEVNLGTPARKFNLILDTGSYVTWVRCPVEKQGGEGSVYDPSNSSTFSQIASCGGSSCYYNQTYHDNSYARGFFVVDKLAIDEHPVIPSFAFLCAQNISEGFNKASGLLALGRGIISELYGKYSFMSQIGSTSDRVFCHCLPTWSESSKGYVYFGKEALEKCHNSGAYTPLLTDPNVPSFYSVNLIAITIGKRRVTMPSVSSSSSSPNAIIDSGTVISRLPSSVYSELQNEFKEWMSNHTLASSDKNQTLDTCYNLSGYSENEIPTIVLHFQNLDVHLDEIAVTWREENSYKVCLAFAGNENENDLTIIGSQQLQKLNVLYNNQDGQLGIEPGNC